MLVRGMTGDVILVTLVAEVSKVVDIRELVVVKVLTAMEIEDDEVLVVKLIVEEIVGEEVNPVVFTELIVDDDELAVVEVIVELMAEVVVNKPLEKIFFNLL